MPVELWTPQKLGDGGALVDMIFLESSSGCCLPVVSCHNKLCLGSVPVGINIDGRSKMSANFGCRQVRAKEEPSFSSYGRIRKNKFPAGLMYSNVHLINRLAKRERCPCLSHTAHPHKRRSSTRLEPKWLRNVFVLGTVKEKNDIVPRVVVVIRFPDCRSFFLHQSACASLTGAADTNTPRNDFVSPRFFMLLRSSLAVVISSV